MTDSPEDFVSFEKALRDLKLQSDELKKMVSQGDIRAFRVGDSMQFRSEDVASLQSVSDGEEELVFADALEDDTGMVTEELSEEDTLLVEDDLEEIEDSSKALPVASRSRREALTSVEETTNEPVWVLATAILGFVILMWGVLVGWDISVGRAPGGLFTGMWAGN